VPSLPGSCGPGDRPDEEGARRKSSVLRIHIWLAGALGFKGDFDEAKAALAEALKLKPELNSFAAQRAEFPVIANPPHWALREKTLNVGLRRIGFPEE